MISRRSFRPESDSRLSHVAGGTDDTFLVPLLMNYQMSAMEESTFKKLMAEQMHTDESALDE